MNEQALIDELKKPEYQGLSDQDAADAINAKTLQQVTKVEAQAIRLTLASRGRLAAIKRIGDNTAAPEPPYDACATLMALLDAGDSIDLQNPAVAASSQVLIQHNLLTQEDADAIANVSRIVDAEDELGAVRASLARVTAAQVSVQERILHMKSRRAPLNAQKREADLTQQLGELSKALTATETSAIKKISTATSDLQQKLKLIEETRDEHIDLLEQELSQLKRNRVAERDKRS